MSINCPKCDKEGRVLDTRKRDGIATRRRECPQCYVRWTTWESGTNQQTENKIKLGTLNQIVAFIESVRTGIEGRKNGTRHIPGTD